MKIIIRFFVAILMIAIVFLPMKAGAQAPNEMSYQAIIRNTSNNLVTNQAIGMRISILQGSTSGTSVYVEIQIPTTNANGLASIEIGGGTVVSGSFSSINWANGPYFIKTETDPNGGTNYSVTGISQLLSVPYALYAENSGNSIPGPQGPQGPVGLQGPVGNNGANGQQGIAGINGTNGKNTLAKTTTEAAGINCATGGFKIEYGLDTNNNGVLDAGEINAIFTKYLCNGAMGTQGAVGATGPQGVSITNSFVQGDSLYVNLSNGQTLNTGKVTGPQGATGTQGPQGLQGIGACDTNPHDMLIVIYDNSSAYGFYQNPQGIGNWVTQSLVGISLDTISSKKSIILYYNAKAWAFYLNNSGIGTWSSLILNNLNHSSISSNSIVVIYDNSMAYAFYINSAGVGTWLSQNLGNTNHTAVAHGDKIILFNSSTAYAFSVDVNGIGTWVTQSLTSTNHKWVITK
jgi:hypothetical protein